MTVQSYIKFYSKLRP